MKYKDTFLDAFKLYQTKEYKKAFDIFLELENKGFKDYDMFMSLGHIYYYNKGYMNANLSYQKAFDLNQNNKTPLMHMLKSHDRLNLPIEMFIEDHFDHLLACDNFDLKDLNKVKNVYIKQNKLHLYEKIADQAKANIKEKSYKIVDYEKELQIKKLKYESNPKNMLLLKNYIDFLEKGNYTDLIKDLLKQAYHNINHFEVDFLNARHYIRCNKLEEARNYIKLMEQKMKKHEKENKKIVYYEYSKLAEIYELLGDEKHQKIYIEKKEGK
jgi:hypothetical protein